MLHQICVSIREPITQQDFWQLHSIALANGLSYSAHNSFLLLAERSERIVAFLEFQLHGNRGVIKNIVVQKKMRRRHIGTNLVNKLCKIIQNTNSGHVELNDTIDCPMISERLRKQRCNGLETLVPETNMLALRFFFGVGFRARYVIPNHFGNADAFTMHYSLRHSQPGPAHMPVNRIKKFGI